MAVPKSTWELLGYKSTPYSTEQIQMGSGGEKLLVGREAELAAIHKEFVNGVQLVALEGDYGVGKSSLATVAAYEASTWHEESQDHLFIPALGREPLELQDGESLGALQKRIYYRIAGALLSKAEQLVADGFQLRGLKAFRLWLTEPAATSWSAGIGANAPGVGGGSLNFGKGKSVNTSAGFNDAGVFELINSWITEIFEGRKASGVILVLDNLENLGKYQGALNVFDSLRDGLFRKPGLVWILCGAEGMVRTALTSKKMAGVFHEPIDILPLPSSQIPNVITARAQILKTRDDAQLPVSADAFGKFYDSTGQNLRFSLGIADSYASKITTSDVSDLSNLDADIAFQAYLVGLGNKVVSDLGKKVGPADWRVLRRLIEKWSGTCSPSEFADFGYADMPPLIARVHSLRDVGLVSYTVVKDDGRKRLISATEAGRLAVLGSASAA